MLIALPLMDFSETAVGPPSVPWRAARNLSERFWLVTRQKVILKVPLLFKNAFFVFSSSSPGRD